MRTEFCSRSGPGNRPGYHRHHRKKNAVGFPTTISERGRHRYCAVTTSHAAEKREHLSGQVSFEDLGQQNEYKTAIFQDADP